MIHEAPADDVPELTPETIREALRSGGESANELLRALRRDHLRAMNRVRWHQPLLRA